MEFVGPPIALLVWTVFCTIAILLTVAAIFSLLKSNKDSLTKLTWVLVIFFLPVVGSVFYFVIGRKDQISKA